MDETPTLDELLTFIKLQNERNIKKLAKHLGIKIEKDQAGNRAALSLESIFKQWLKSKGTAATREDVVLALQEIEENTVSQYYYQAISSLQTSKSMQVNNIIIVLESI